jgi:hypothetical protein
MAWTICREKQCREAARKRLAVAAMAKLEGGY